MSSSPNGSDHEEDAVINAVFPTVHGDCSPTTPARSTRLSYGSPQGHSKVRKAKNHATSPAAGRECPPKRVSDDALNTLHIRSVPSFDPVATAPRAADNIIQSGTDPSPTNVAGDIIADLARDSPVPSQRSMATTVEQKPAASKAKPTTKSPKPAATKQIKKAANLKIGYNMMVRFIFCFISSHQASKVYFLADASRDAP